MRLAEKRSNAANKAWETRRALYGMNVGSKNAKKAVRTRRANAKRAKMA